MLAEAVVESRYSGLFCEQTTVNIFKGFERFVQIGLACCVGLVQDLEQFGNCRACVLTVFTGVLNEFQELAVIAKNACVVGKEAEQQTGKKNF